LRVALYKGRGLAVKKISVMIVDDEKLVLEDLSTIVDWEAHGFEIVATAVNGKQALAKFRQYRPQVIFTDIKMPFMDGIELIKQIREMDNQVQIIILTAYEDFNYAKSAIQHGIMDYVIKSAIDSQSASNLLRHIAAVIVKQGQVLDILKEKQISDFFYTDENDKGPVEVDMFRTPYFYLMIEQDMPVNLPGDYVIDSIRIQNNDIISVLLDKENPEFRIIAASHTPRDQILLVLDIAKSSRAEINRIIYQAATEYKSKLEDRFQTRFTIYMVSVKMNLFELKALYKNKSNSLYQKYLMDGKGIYDLVDFQPARPGRIAEPALDSGLIADCIEEYNEEKIREYIGKLFLAVINYKGLFSLSRALYDLLLQYYRQLDIYSDSWDLSFESNWKYWLDAKSLRNWFANAYIRLIWQRKNTNYQKYSKMISQAMEYIHKNYDDCNLSIKDIADAVQLSTGYLCVLFKKETGKTLNNYIAEVRINQAKKMLREHNLKVYEISEAVGFKSSQYFSQVFIKLVGMIPNEYRKGIKSDAD